MLTIFKKLFGKAAPPAAPVAPVAPAAPSAPMPSIEVAHLSLAAIVARLPEELKPLVVGEPDETATVALPLPTIMKQLPAGCVKMSLATLQRQAHGLLTPLAPGDKRMVDVPLAEVFKHVKLSALKRRPDQRVIPIPDTGYNLFADSSNPYALSPDDHLEQIDVMDIASDPEDLNPATEPVAPAGQRVLKMDDGLRQHFANTSATQPGPAAEAPASLKFEFPDSAPRMAPVPRMPAPAPVLKEAPITKPTGPTLDLKLAPLSAGWPDEIRQEVAGLDAETVVTLPIEEIGKGLSKGRVTFTWAHIRAWMEPGMEGPTAAAGATVLQLPLKLVAPAYLSASKKPKVERKSVDMDESIPALFSDGREPEVAAPAPVSVEVSGESSEAPVALETSEAPLAEASVAPSVEEAVPEPAVAAAAPQEAAVPETIGQLLGDVHKQHWTPTELVAGAVKLPGVAGAIVALQEGLQVASSLPEGVKSEVVAAFLPQIFARLNQYSGEMKLGDVDDLLFTTHGAHCQIYRLGYVYLAVLGKPGEPLPWHALRLISEELARQTHK